MPEPAPAPPAVPRSPAKVWPWVVAGILVAALIGALLYQAWPVLYPRVVQRAPVDPSCDLRAGPCRTALGEGGEVSFVIEPRSIPVMQPLQVRVEVKGLEPQGVDVDFAGVDMNMGFNRVRLASAGPGRYQGEAMVPVCVRERMSWEAQVLVETPRGILSAPFRFSTWRSGAPER